MKRLVGVLVTVLILYAIYYDLSEGTLPASYIQQPVTKTSKTSNSEAKQKDEQPYFEEKVDAGDTVISIIEGQLNQSIDVPISDVVTDFKKLNKNLSPQEIQPGKVYKFPDYSK